MMIQIVMASIEPLLRSYGNTKWGIEQSIPFDADWLHLAIGPIIFVAAALAMRRPASAWGPWSTVILLAVLNEAVDLTLNEAPSLTAKYFESSTDFLLTMAVPTLLLILALYFPAAYENLGLAQKGAS